MKRSQLFHLYEKASTRYHLALNGWRIDSPSGWKAVKSMFSGEPNTAPVKGTVKVAKRVPDVTLLRDARNASEAAYLSKKPRQASQINSDIARLAGKASKVESRAVKAKKTVKNRKNRLRVMVIEDLIALLQKEAGLSVPSTPATVGMSSAKANAKSSKKSMKKARKNRTKVTFRDAGTLDLSNLTDRPREHNWAKYLTDPNVETAYRYFNAEATRTGNKADHSYWSARLFTRQNPTITSQHEALEAWKGTVDTAQHVLMEAREGIKAEFALRREVNAATGSPDTVGVH